MKNLKKIIFAIVAVTILLTNTSCRKNKEEDPMPQNLTQNLPNPVSDSIITLKYLAGDTTTAGVKNLDNITFSKNNFDHGLDNDESITLTLNFKNPTKSIIVKAIYFRTMIVRSERSDKISEFQAGKYRFSGGRENNYYGLRVAFEDYTKNILYVQERH